MFKTGFRMLYLQQYNIINVETRNFQTTCPPPLAHNNRNIFGLLRLLSTFIPMFYIGRILLLYYYFYKQAVSLWRRANARNTLSVLAVHRPCISTLPTQHTAFITFMKGLVIKYTGVGLWRKGGGVGHHFHAWKDGWARKTVCTTLGLSNRC